MLSGCLASRYRRPFEETTASVAGGARLLDVCQERPRSALGLICYGGDYSAPVLGKGEARQRSSLSKTRPSFAMELEQAVSDAGYHIFGSVAQVNRALDLLAKGRSRCSPA